MVRDEIACPHCRQLILRAAILCKHCRRYVEPNPQPVAVNQSNDTFAAKEAGEQANCADLASSSTSRKERAKRTSSSPFSQTAPRRTHVAPLVVILLMSIFSYFIADLPKQSPEKPTRDIPIVDETHRFRAETLIDDTSTLDNNSAPDSSGNTPTTYDSAEVDSSTDRSNVASRATF